MSRILDPYTLFPVSSGYSIASETGVKLWIRGDSGSTASQLDDHSGNNNHAVQATGGNQATVSAGGITANGTSTFYTLTSPITVPDDGFSIYAIIDRAGTGDRGLFTGTASAAACFRISGDNKMTLLRSHATDCGSNTTAIADNKELVVCTFTTTLRSFFLNGVADGTNSSTVSSWGAIDRLFCDYDGANNGDWFNGILYELVLADDLHDSTVMGRITTDMLTRNSV